MILKLYLCSSNGFTKTGSQCQSMRVIIIYLLISNASVMEVGDNFFWVKWPYSTNFNIISLTKVKSITGSSWQRSLDPEEWEDPIALEIIIIAHNYYIGTFHTHSRYLSMAWRAGPQKYSLLKKSSHRQALYSLPPLYYNTSSSEATIRIISLINLILVSKNI